MKIAFDAQAQNALDNPLPFTAVLYALICLLFPYHHGILYHSLFYSAAESLILAVILGCILWICIRLDLAKVTVGFLALPYLFFIPGWLNWPTAIILLGIFLYCLKTSLLKLTATRAQQITVRDLLAFVMIAVIVNISGAGGYGFQWNDWNMHNARLKDLIEYTWPVRYGDNQNFVYYFGYFLPSAVIGKLTTLDIGLRSLFVWTLLGVTLAVRWLAYLGNTRFTLALALLFILFGPLDILNVIIVNVLMGNALSEALPSLLHNPHALDFTMSDRMPFFLGNYLSNTFNLYWSPQQVIASWLCIALITHLYWQQQTRQLVFVYALLCLWGPLVMIAIFPFVALACLQQIANNKPRVVFTIENILGAGSLAVVFVLFYLGGSAGANPSFWVFDYFDSLGPWIVMAIMYLHAWGIYTLAISGHVAGADVGVKTWFACLLFALFVLPLYIFGEWSDLLCRGSSPLMFLLLVFLLRAIQHYRERKQRWKAALLIGLLIPGMGSAFLTNRISLRDYGQTQPVASVISYDNAYPNLGPDNTLFNRFLRRQPPSP